MALVSWLGGPKEGETPSLGLRMHTLQEMGLNVVFEACRATGVVVVPDGSGILGGKQAVEEFEGKEGSGARVSDSGAKRREVDQLEDRGNPVMDFATFCKKGVLGSGRAYVMPVMAGSSMARNIKLGMSVRAKGYLVPQGRGVIPLEVSSFVVGVNIELGRKSRFVVGLLLILMAFHVGKFGRKREVGEGAMKVFNKIPVWGKSGGGKIGNVFVTLADAGKQVFVISGKGSRPMDRLGAKLSQMVQ
jgi:hypothetical protein